MIAFDARQYRAALALSGLNTTKALAPIVGVSEQRLAQIASGMIPPDGLRERIASALNVKPSDLWRECVPVEGVR